MAAIDIIWFPRIPSEIMLRTIAFGLGLDAMLVRSIFNLGKEKKTPGSNTKDFNSHSFHMNITVG